MKSERGQKHGMSSWALFNIFSGITLLISAFYVQQPFISLSRPEQTVLLTKQHNETINLLKQLTADSVKFPHTSQAVKSKFYQEDFETYFNLRYLEFPYESDELKQVLDAHDVSKDWAYRNTEEKQSRNRASFTAI